MGSVAGEEGSKETPSGRFFRCYRPDLSLAVLKRDRRFQFFGSFDLQVLYGSINVCGYKFEASAYSEKKFIPICAPYMLGPPITVSSISSENHFNFSRLKWRIQELSADTSSILDMIYDGDAVLLLRFLVSKAALCARNLYDTALFVPPSTCASLTLDSVCCVLLDEWPSSATSTNKNLATLLSHLQKKRNEDITSVVMIIGGKSAGKSTSARYIANSLLGKDNAPVYFLDADVGQSEANPPGCVSLFRVESPMLGVPFCTQRRTLTHSFFFGDISPSAGIEHCSRLVAKLYERFKSKAFPGSVLIVNTPGWVEGDGVKFLDRLISIISPDCLFNISTKDGPNYRGEGIRMLEEVEGAVVINHISNLSTTPMTSVPFTLTPAAIRNLLILGYMAPLCPTPSLGSLGDAAPYAVPFGRIAVNLNPGLGSVPDTHLLAVLNCAFVALCSVRWEEDHIKGRQHVLNDEDMPGIIEGEDVVLQCVGFGFIRAIDLNERLFYVLTPVAEEALPEVNVFAKGVNIDLPNVFFTQRRSVEAPYVLADNKGPASDMYSELAVISCHKRAQSNRRRI
uniref:Polynucleotide 5'-hydroxyl-kinase NOL9 n=1 Tax=Parascaris univalens TaxID=6257 RepID=A0A915AB24_PARUN